MSIIGKVWKKRWMLRSIIPTIWFNFHYLPFRQAINLPIILYKPDLLKCKGKVVIQSPKLSFGMIRLGYRSCNIYPNTGITWENHGGTMVFRGRTLIGNDSYVSVGPQSTILFEDDFKATASLKLVSYRGVKFGKGTRLGWGCLVMDTNFHPLFDMEKKKYKKASGPIEIGDYNWFGTQCKIMHSTITPERCIFGMNTTVTRNCVKESYCVMGGDPVKILTRNVMRDYEHDTEVYD